MARNGSKTTSPVTSGTFYVPGSETKILVTINECGLAENPRFQDHYWDDLVAELLGEVTIQGAPYYQVSGPFFAPDLALKFGCSGHGKRPDENYVRTLAIACEEHPELSSKLFAPKTLTFPQRWFSVVDQGDMEPSLSKIERHYQIYLPDAYLSFGRRKARGRAEK